jgi:hypothetical protein
MVQRKNQSGKGIDIGLNEIERGKRVIRERLGVWVLRREDRRDFGAIVESESLSGTPASVKII